MVDFIEPLNLQMWIVNVFAGSQEMFLAIAMFFIFLMGGYFRMNNIVMAFMFFIFLVLFTLWIPGDLLLLVAMIGGLVVGKIVSQIV